jgi:transcriptional regulator with XRE-family HTH domain
MSEVGQEVKRQREARGWTQAKLAVEAGMAPSAVNQIENGKRSPSATSLSKLAGALEVEIADLFPKVPSLQPPLPLDSDLEDRMRALTERVSALIGESKDALESALEDQASEVPRDIDEAARTFGEAIRERSERPGALKAALEAAKRQAKQDAQAANRAAESGQPQTYFMRHETDALHYLLQLDKDELADALLDMARMVVELKVQLEVQRKRSSETHSKETTARSASA